MKKEHPQQQFVLLPKVKHRVRQVKRRLQDRRRQRAVAAVCNFSGGGGSGGGSVPQRQMSFTPRQMSFARDNVQLKHNLNDPFQVLKILCGLHHDLSHPL